MHGQASKGLYVGVSVMDRVDVLVKGLDMDEPMCKVEVELTVEGNPKGSQAKHDQVPGVGEGLLVRKEGKTIGGIAVHESSLPDRELHNPKEGVEHVVEHFDKAVLPVREKWPL